MILTGAAITLPDRVLDPATIVIENGTIAAVEEGRVAGSGVPHVDLSGHLIVPGLVDVHVHGVAGRDVLDGPGAVAAVAAALPAYGVTAFCPTSVACAPDTLRGFLAQVRAARESPAGRSARVIGAHLESNFINPDYRGAQPAGCLRVPPGTRSSAEGRTSSVDRRSLSTERSAMRAERPVPSAEYDGGAILREIERAQADVAIVTLAPELEGALTLIADLVGLGIRVSLGHSGATYEQALAAIEAGARHATHLFNRMPPLGHRTPGLAGAVLAHADVVAELIADGVHVHPAMLRMAVAAKGLDRTIAITDGTAGAGLPPGARALLGHQPITVRETAAYLDDGTLAGSTLTLDEALRRLVQQMQFTIVDAVHLCATTPARALRLLGHGVIAEGAVADLVILDTALKVRRTIIGGVEVFNAEP